MSANRGLKTLVILLWLGLLALALAGISYLLYRRYSPFNQASPRSESTATLQATPSLEALPIATGLPRPEATATPLVLPAASATEVASQTPLVSSPTATQSPADDSALLFLGPDGCSVQKVVPAAGQVLPVTLHVPSFGCQDSRLSPDGTRLAFLMAGSSSRLYTMKVDGSGLVQVSPGYAYDYAWSPDGQHLAYVGYIADQGVLGLYFADADGGSLTHSAYSGLAIPSVDIHIAWSPDGAWVYAPAEDPPGGAAYPFALNANGSESLQLDDAPIDPTSLVTWSPDSQKVLYLQSGYDYLYAVTMLRMLGLDGSREVIFYDDPTVEGPTLSPEGRFLACPFWSVDGRLGLLPAKSSMQPGVYQLLLLDARTRELSLLVNLDRPADLAAWSPSGSLVAFVALPDPEAGGENALMVVSADGSGLRSLVEGVGAAGPVWVAH